VVERHAEAVREAWGRGAYDDREIDFPAGKDHPHYRHGKFVGEKRPDYPAEFSHRLREKMREQQDRKCAVCGERSNQHLDVHHINGDKHNNTPENLVALCRTCHMNMEHTSQEVQDLLYSTGTDPEWTLNDRVVV
jgi:nitrate/TMAO reductase-like tetraheme cytochrome c subunit